MPRRADSVLRRLAPLVLLLGLAAGCTRLPDYARPTVAVVDVAQLAKSDGIAYRKLTRDDFRAKAPPIDAAHAEQMSAFTCANVVPRGGFLMEVRPDPATGEAVARLRQIAFVARMDRRCSWWNPKPSDDSTAYILQHEQIHFAIAELAARDLSARAAQLSVRADSIEAAQAALQRAIDALMREVMDELTARNTEFDSATSGRHEPELQQRWYDQLKRELSR